jgi:hypothetical protein
MLFSPVFANPYLRPASSPATLRVLSALCVKNPPFAHSRHAVSHKTSLIITYDRSTQGDVSCTLLHQNANSTHLSSTRCALFCNYGGGGGSPITRFSRPRVANSQGGASRQKGGLPARSGDRLSPYFHFSISFRNNTYGRTPRFAVFWPQSSVNNFFRINTCRGNNILDAQGVLFYFSP